jgi:hypothetical protein
MATQIKLRRDTDANWTTNSTVVLGEGEIGVNLTSGEFKLGDGASTWAQLTYFVAGVGSSDRLTNGLNEFILNTAGVLVYPNSALQRDTGVINCAGNASTMIYTTSSVSNQHTIKLLIQVEGTEGASAVLDTQACEMIIAKSFRADAIAASVYGVVHTSVAPLATFTAEWNVLTSKVEVLCTTPSANGVSVKIFATEITTSD